MRYLFTLTCLLLATATLADEADFDFKSKKAKAAVQKYQDASRKSNKRNLDSLIRSLEAAFKHERTDGDFEEAIKIRDTIKALEKGADPTGTSVAGSKSKKSKARIANAVGVWKEISHGKTYFIIRPDGTARHTGQAVAGVWKSTNKSNQSFKIKWENGFVEEIQISTNGEVLNGITTSTGFRFQMARDPIFKARK